MIVEMAARGIRGGVIARELNELGLKTQKGNPWSLGAVRQFLDARRRGTPPLERRAASKAVAPESCPSVEV
jgi:hypothetical protein